MPTIPLSIYLNDKEYVTYTKDKDKHNTAARQALKQSVGGAKK